MTLDHLRAPDTPIAELQSGHDSTRETTPEALAAGSKWNFLPFHPAWSAGTASASIPPA
jgi:hypothetical protein